MSGPSASTYSNTRLRYCTHQRSGDLTNDPSIIATYNGAVVRRTVDQSHAVVPEHAHDWHVLSLFVSGSYRNRTQLGEAVFAGPSAILYRPGAAHENHVGRYGFEQIEIEFDRKWLGDFTLPDRPVFRWAGGKMAALSRSLARRCAESGFGSENSLQAGVIAFLEQVQTLASPVQPNWLARVQIELESSSPISVRQLAERVGLHPFWIGQAYKHATGETLQQAKSRIQVQRAVILLRETGEEAASIAVAAGFYDQSHMIRMFRRVLGRKPSEVRADCFRGSPVASIAG